MTGKETEMRLANKVAIITGAGSGIGRASAYLFAREGSKLVVADINDAGGEETVTTIMADGGEAVFVHADVSIASEVENLVKVTKDKFGKIDILFNNAGTYIRPTAVEATEESWWDRIYAVNVKGIFLATKYVVPEMKKAGGGVIINTASGAGVRPLSNISAYASSKGAVITLTKQLAHELGPDNIRVNCILPGLTDTPMVLLSEEQRKARLSTIPLGRLIKPEDIAYAALYLASYESSMVTGTSITVDGGLTI